MAPVPRVLCNRERRDVSRRSAVALGLRVLATRARFLFLGAFVALTFAVWAYPQPVLAQHTYVDRRVSAIPNADLLARSPFDLVDARRQQSAGVLVRFTRPLFFVWAASQILMLLYLWRSGRAARLRALLARYVRSPVGLRFVYGAALALLAQLAALPATFAAYRLAVGFGLTAQSPLDWVRDTLFDAVLAAACFGALAAFILSLVARTRLWYLYAVCGLFAFALCVSLAEPVAIAPLFDRFEPLSNSDPIARELRPLERRAGVDISTIYVDDLDGKRDVATANVAGFGSMQRIVLAQALLRSATPGEVAFVTAHELGHYVHRDAYRLALFGTLLFVLSVVIAVTLADRIGFRHDDDPLSRLALVAAVLGAVGLLFFPAYNALERRLETGADHYALAITGDRASAARTFVRYADETLTPLCPSWFERIYFDDHAPLGNRIARAEGRRGPCR